MAKPLFSALCFILFVSSCTQGPAGSGGPAAGFEAWPAPVEVRIYQGAFSRDPDCRAIRLEGLAGEYLSAQVVVKSGRDIKGLAGELSELAGPGGAVIPAAAGRVRYGGFIPVDETMCMTADPLLEETSVEVLANQARPVWLTLRVPPETTAGSYRGRFELSASSGGRAGFEVSLEVLPARLPDPPDWSFYLNIWQDPTPVAAAHRVELWSEEHWKMLERYAENFAAHGMKGIMTHIVYDPWQSVRGYASDAMVEWKYPGEFKPGGADRFEWDFTVFDRYVELMIKAGVRRRIDCYSLVMGPGGTTDAHIRYLDTSAGTFRTARLSVGEPLWREAWAAFLPVLRGHLKEKGWFDKAVIGFDEKPEEVMRTIFDFLNRTVPDFKVGSSGGFPGDDGKLADEIVLIIDNLTDPSLWKQYEPLVKRMRQDKDRIVSFYTCCWPHFPNTFLFSGLRESRLMPWLAWKYGLDGYLRWAVNLYPEDVWNQPLFTWPSGDMFFVYPGRHGPLDSMRWELLRQGIQDYEALRIAWEMAERAGREDLLDKLREAVDTGTIIDSCSWIPYIAEARKTVNQVIRELGAPV
ncbi:MAG: DUF4091 domain-containing protein [Candidatus Glassbacteria bacterium]|nr:DUF4091 domain-containing protein [Candidatus Glassbacteria bacterium]